MFHPAQDGHFVLNQVLLSKEGFREVGQKPRNPLLYLYILEDALLWTGCRGKHLPWCKDKTKDKSV